MSKHNNVNPDHYKVAGRERQGENVIHAVERREAKRARRGASPASRKVPGAFRREDHHEEKGE